MKIYFAAAISQKETFGEMYLKIVKALQDGGHKVQHEHITKSTMQDVIIKSNDERVKYYQKALRWISAADVVVIEASFPSTLNIGHEITVSLNRGKPVIVLYKKGHDSFFLHGLTSDRLFLVEYTEDNISEVVKDSLEYAKDQADTRFNFFISPSLSHYLDWISQRLKVPRSVYLRRLIKEDRDKHPEYGALTE